jgi:hypothetical protein
MSATEHLGIGRRDLVSKLEAAVIDPRVFAANLI